MSMSNYPPGVTGNEDYFGPDAEVEMDVVCGRSTTLAVYTPGLKEEVDRLLAISREGRPDLARLHRLLFVIDSIRQEIRDLPTVETICPWDGPLDVSVYGRGPSARVEWTCPACGYEHTEVSE